LTWINALAWASGFRRTSTSYPLSRSTIDALSLARDIFSSTRRAERPGCPAPHVSYTHLLLLPTPDVFPVEYRVAGIRPRP
jgi:hypothetical protein